MIRQVQNWTLKIMDIGVQDRYDSIKRNRIQIANALFVFVLPLIIINTVNNIIEGDAIGLILGFIWFAFLAIPLIFNYYSKHKWAYGFLIILCVIVGNSGFIMFGREVILSPIYIFGILCCIFFFDRFYTRLGIIAFIILNYIIVHEFFLANYEPLILNAIAGYGVHLYFFFSVFGVIATTVKILGANKKQIKETQKLNKQLERKNQEFERFAYITSHDLKEPIRNISRFSGLIKRKSRDGEDITEYLEFVNQNARYLDNMVDAIRDFVKISEERLSFDNVNIEEVLNIVEASLSEKIQNSNASIYLEKPITIPAIKEQLVILFQHLIENAIKYNNHPTPKIEIFVKTFSAFYEFQMKDNGIGVAEEFNRHIFKPFKKLHHKSKYEGAGVGLSICHRIIENHNGKIWVENNDDGGASFYFTISKHL